MILNTHNKRMINVDMVSEFFLDGDIIKGILEKAKKSEVVELAKLNNSKNSGEKFVTFLNGLKSDKVNLIFSQNVTMMFDNIDSTIELEIQELKKEKEENIKGKHNKTEMDNLHIIGEVKDKVSDFQGTKVVETVEEFKTELEGEKNE